MKQTMNKEDLIKMGYNPYTAISIIRQAKQIMVQKGYAFYNNRRLGHVPTAAVEEILGVSLHKEEYCQKINRKLNVLESIQTKTVNFLFKPNLVKIELRGNVYERNQGLINTEIHLIRLQKQTRN